MKIFLAALLATSSMPAFAQTSTRASTLDDPTKPTAAGLSPARDIVVTAQRRPQALIDVPARISILPEDMLPRLNASDFSKVADSVPGVAFATTGAGSSQSILRGRPRTAGIRLSRGFQ